MHPKVARIAALCGWLLHAACGGSNDQATSADTQACVPGTVYSCVRASCTGNQRCLEDGSAMTPCMCAGTDEVGGSSGVSNPLQPKDAGPTPPRDGGQSAGSGAMRDAGTMRDAGPSADAAMPEAGHSAAAPPAAERCDNGQDDDGDGKVDCADDDCKDMRCIDAAPSDWQGPVAFRTAADAIHCAGAFSDTAFEAGDAPNAAPASCSACTCDGSCSEFLEFGTSDAAMCGGTSCSTSVNASCVQISPQCLQTATTASLATALPNAPACTASPQHADVPSASWKTHVAACAPAAAHGGGCRDQQRCLPANPGAGFEAAYCVWRDGEQDCPSQFAHRRLYYREFEDTRGCSACSCAAASCSYTWRVFNVDDAMCASPVLELSSAGQCAQINPVMGKLRVGAKISSDKPCTAGGGESQGAVNAIKPLTVCCAM